MDDILIYSDSLTWGIVPDSRERLSFEKRWPGVFETALKEKGANSTTKCTTLYLSSPAHFFKHYGWLLEPKTLSWS